MPASVTLPIFTRVNGVEVDLGTMEVPVDVHAALLATAPPGPTVRDVSDFDTPPGAREFQTGDGRRFLHAHGCVIPAPHLDDCRAEDGSLL